MKKVILIILAIIFITPAFAEYKPIPPDLSKKYKAEIEQKINNEYGSTQQKINSIYNEATKDYKKVFKNKETYMDFASSNYDIHIFIPIFDLLSDLIDITNKYVDIKNEIPATDFSGTLYDFLQPYFDDNKIDTHKIDKLSKNARKKQKRIEYYYDNTHKFIYPNDNY